MSVIGNAVCALNKIGKVDQAFFIVCAVIIALIVAVYFLIPVFNKKFYKEQRENLHKREAAFKSNLKNSQAATDEEQEQQEAEVQANADSSDE